MPSEPNARNLSQEGVEGQGDAQPTMTLPNDQREQDARGHVHGGHGGRPADRVSAIKIGPKFILKPDRVEAEMLIGLM